MTLWNHSFLKTLFIYGFNPFLPLILVSKFQFHLSTRLPSTVPSPLVLLRQSSWRSGGGEEELS